jgi:hypothetical protein
MSSGVMNSAGAYGYERGQEQGYERSAYPDLVDSALMWLALLGVYMDLAVYLSATVPVPSIILGAAGLLMLLKNAGRIEERHIIALVGVILLYALSILSVSDYSYLFGRLKGLIQLTYSFLIGYGFYLTALKYDRASFSRFFLVFCAFILFGCFLEDYSEGFRNLSDAFRQHVYSFGLYTSDIRDELLYGRVRPKLFTSEPSAVTFAFTLFSFAWYVVSTWRFKPAVYLGMLAAGYVLMRGPTLFIGVALVVPYEILLAARNVEYGHVRYNSTRILVAVIFLTVLIAGAVVAGTTFYAARLEEIASGSDPSFFSRTIGPYLTAKAILAQHPLAGVGLTGWEGMADTVSQIYATTSDLAIDWDFDKVSHALANYFWDHWIFLGLFWGVTLLAGLSFYLRALRVPSLAFCWCIWAAFGQASGAYVSPKTWFVLYLAACLAILQQREPITRAFEANRRQPVREPQLHWGYDLR